MFYRVPANRDRLNERIFQIPEKAFDGLVFHFIIGQHGLRGRVPVDQPFAAINQPIGKKLEKHRPHCFGTNLVHGKACPVPVAGTPHALELPQNSGLIFILPALDVGHEFLAGKVRPAFALLGQKLLFNHSLCSYPRVVRSRHPQGCLAQHPMKPYQNILKCIVQGVAQMQGGRYIRRRNHDRISLFWRRRLLIRMIIPSLCP